MIPFFWLIFFIIFYTFLGYGILLYGLILLKRLFVGKKEKPYPTDENWPTISFVVAVFNEAYILDKKIANSFSLDYPAHLIQYLFVSDGSTDGSDDIIAKHPEILLMHQQERQGKLAAIERAMAATTGEILIFSDGNTILNQAAIKEIAKHYTDEKVGCVAGEKKVLSGKEDDAAGSESLYWKYESKLKAWDSELHSVVGAAGELFSVRKKLYVSVPQDTVLDDFMISMKIAGNGYKTVYEPKAYAMEYSSANVQEEYKRKVRIAAGGMQSMVRLSRLLLPFPNPVLWFQYISHRVLRWSVTPFLMIALLLVNILIVQAQHAQVLLYDVFLGLQISFYLLALLGWNFEHRSIKIKGLFIPYYFCMMNVAVIAGIVRYFSGNQSVRWEKARRKVTA